MGGETRELARLITNTEYRDFPVETITLAKLCMMDLVGVTLLGAKEPVTEVLLKVAKEIGSQPQATVIGRGEKVSVLDAAMINGTAGHSMDYDDTHLGPVGDKTLGMNGHPSVPVLPAVFAAAEWNRLRGQDLLTAFLVGFEVECRIGFAVNPEHYDAGWHSTGPLGQFGAAAASAKILGLDEQATVNALGIAGTTAGGIRESLGSMCKPLHAGKAAANGLHAALLAKKGFTAPQTILEGLRGFCRIYSTKLDSERLLNGWGESWEVKNVLFKTHASCYSTHAIVEAMLRVREKHNIAPESVLSIDASVGKLALDVAGNPRPSIGLEGKFSLHYCAALALAEGSASGAYFTDEWVRNPRLVALRDKVHIQAAPELVHTQVLVKVRTKDREIEEYVNQLEVALEPVRRSASVPKKFKEIVGSLLPKERLERLQESIERFEHVPDVADFASLLA